MSDPSPDAPPAPIATDLPCQSCSYNLRGLSADTRCPECGHPVPLTLAAGPAIRSDPLWLHTLSVGAALALAANGASLAETLWRWMSYLSIGLSEADVINFRNWWAWRLTDELRSMLPLLFWLAAWLLTRPHPNRAGTSSAGVVRAALRAAATVQFVIALFPVLWRNGGLRPAVAALDTAAGLAVTVLFFVHLRNLARLVPDAFLARHALLAMVVSLAAFAFSNLVPYLAPTTTFPAYLSPTMRRTLGALLFCISLVYAIVVSALARRSFARIARMARDNREPQALPTKYFGR